MKSVVISFRAMGTVNTIEVQEKTAGTYHDPRHPGNSDHDPRHPGEAQLCARAIRDQIMDLDARWSAFRPESEIARINAAAGKEAVAVQPDTIRILKDSVKYAKLTHGLFDITTRPLSALWGIGKKGDFIPSEEERKEATALVGFSDLVLTDKTAMLKREGQGLDLGGIAKGYATDLAVSYFLAHGVTSFLLNFGGTIASYGEERKVGVRNPFFGMKEMPTNIRTTEKIGYISVRNACVVTSGVYERYFMKNGVRYHHILDPRTGMPIASGIASVTLTGKSAEELDAICTSVFLVGADEGSNLARTHGAMGVIIGEDGRVFISPKLKFER